MLNTGGGGKALHERCFIISSNLNPGVAVSQVRLRAWGLAKLYKAGLGCHVIWLWFPLSDLSTTL